MNIIEFVSQPWPWYVAGPILGLFVPLLLFVGNRQFGVSENFRHMCAAIYPGNAPFLKYDWKNGMWNIVFLLGALAGGFVAAGFLASPSDIALSEAAVRDLGELGITDFSGIAPAELFSWSELLSPLGLLLVVVGGFLVGFGSRYAGGCTSGHAIFGLSSLQVPSLIAVLGFFVGGLIVTHLILPLVL